MRSRHQPVAYSLFLGPALLPIACSVENQEYLRTHDVMSKLTQFILMCMVQKSIAWLCHNGENAGTCCVADTIR